ncbi:MAG TPA: hypothetical protein VJ782_01525 [Aeromicrobium sp.]|nr:hypothetical protein [Aeromicrobium sp.]
MVNRIRLNSKGIAAILKSPEMQRATRKAAEAVADNVRAQGITVGDRDGGKNQYPIPVTVTMSTTDRAHANVTLAHPAGQAVQAKHGSLTKAAAQAGLDVRGQK